MGTLDGLAEELIDHIFEKLVCPTDTKALAALSLVSRKFHHIVEPHLYHTINLRFMACDQGQSASRTLFQNPRLAQHIKILTAVRRDVVTNDVEEEVPGDRVVDSDRFPDHSARNTMCDRLLLQITDLAVNVTALDFSNYCWGDGIQLATFLRLMRTSRPSLRSLSVGPSTSEAAVIIHDFFFTTKSLVEVSLSNGIFYPPSDSQPSLPVFQSMVKHLTLRNFGAGKSTHVSSIAVAFSQLESLSLLMLKPLTESSGLPSLAMAIGGFKELYAGDSFQPLEFQQPCAMKVGAPTWKTVIQKDCSLILDLTYDIASGPGMNFSIHEPDSKRAMSALKRWAASGVDHIASFETTIIMICVAVEAFQSPTTVTISTEDPEYHTELARLKEIFSYAETDDFRQQH